MPELPEVETTRVGISPHIEGQTLQHLVVRDSRLRWPVPSDLGLKVVGKHLKRVIRRGKYLLFEFDQRGAGTSWRGRTPPDGLTS